METMLGQNEDLTVIIDGNKGGCWRRFCARKNYSMQRKNSLPVPRRACLFENSSENCWRRTFFDNKKRRPQTAHKEQFAAVPALLA